MPKYKHDAKEFTLAVNIGAGQYRATMPKMLLERLDTAVAITGTFILSEDRLVLREEYRHVTTEQLCSRFWPVPGVSSKEELDELDWDDLLTRIGLELHNPAGKNIVISDWDDKTYDQFHVTFSTE